MATTIANLELHVYIKYAKRKAFEAAMKKWFQLTPDDVVTTLPLEVDPLRSEEEQQQEGYLYVLSASLPIQPFIPENLEGLIRSVSLFLATRPEVIEHEFEAEDEESAEMLQPILESAKNLITRATSRAEQLAQEDVSQTYPWNKIAQRRENLRVASMVMAQEDDQEGTFIEKKAFGELFHWHYSQTLERLTASSPEIL